MTYTSQVDRSHYHGHAYRFLERWDSYWHQLQFVRLSEPKSVLEVGVGGGTVARELRASGVSVTTVDIAEDLEPDVVGSITALPFPDNSFDLSLAAEVIEHIRFEDVPQALSELARVARTHVVVSIPNPGYVFSLNVKIPMVKRIIGIVKIPFFWKEHIFNGEHYWELGKKGYSLRLFLECANKAGLTLQKTEVYADDPAHRFFLFSTQA